MSNSVTVGLPNNATVKITGLTNSGWWTQRITVAPSSQPATAWTGTGAQDNKVVGQMDIQPGASTTLTITMDYDDGSGFKPSAVENTPFEMPGLTGYIIGGQDGGGRPVGPAYWNTVVFVYWATGY